MRGVHAAAPPAPVDVVPTFDALDLNVQATIRNQESSWPARWSRGLDAADLIGAPPRLSCRCVTCIRNDADLSGDRRWARQGRPWCAARQDAE